MLTAKTLDQSTRIHTAHTMNTSNPSSEGISPALTSDFDTNESAQGRLRNPCRPMDRGPWGDRLPDGGRGVEPGSSRGMSWCPSSDNPSLSQSRRDDCSDASAPSTRVCRGSSGRGWCSRNRGAEAPNAERPNRVPLKIRQGGLNGQDAWVFATDAALHREETMEAHRSYSLGLMNRGAKRAWCVSLIWTLMMLWFGEGLGWAAEVGPRIVPQVGHLQPIIAAAFSPDDRYLATMYETTAMREFLQDILSLFAHG